MILYAMDRATVRSFDADGRLHVQSSHISKANICPYMGSEIPRWQELGLEPDRIYKLLRHPDELAAGAATFNNLPVLSEHVPVTAIGEDSHMPGLVVGSTGTDAEFTGEFLDNSLVIWAKPSIDGIVNNQKRQLSSAYRYRADMTPGNYQGVDYDGVMRDIVGNHVALVFEGRAGSDVIVGDEQPMSIKSKRALMVAGSLGALIRPLLAQDGKLNLGTALDGVTDKSLKPVGAARTLGEKVFGLVQPHLAADAVLDVDAVTRAIEAVQPMALDGDDDLPAAEDADDDDKDKPAEDADDNDDDAPAEDADDDDKDKPAMDRKTVQTMVDKARRDARADYSALRTAENEVRPVVGELPAMDSAADVYRAGLEAMGVDLNGLPKSSYGATFRAVHAARAKAAPIAQDGRPSSRQNSDFAARYPNRVSLIRG